MDSNIVHLVGEELLDLQEDLGAPLELVLGELGRSEGNLLHLARDLGLEDAGVIQQLDEV